jgi:D-alanyl-lipoteichoic acid acyltransferase DltB (MBOAT superfamily)
MLFNSYVFLLAFLPVTLLVFLWIEGRGLRQAALLWLTVASLFFYAWWNPPFVALILASLAFNFGLGRALSRRAAQPGGRARWPLAAGIAANLALLGYFKYWNFLLENAGWLVGRRFASESIFLPLGISFFTFQQIAFLVDARRGGTREYDPVHYGLFVTFFPQLIAGPIVHHAEVMPQFARPRLVRPESPLFAAGLTLLAIGLAKKTVIADSFAPLADGLFDAAEAGERPAFLASWTGVLAYTLQIYFDFSGYSDMAVGLGWLFGIVLPLNFFSPYRASSVIEFWRRWHMTLSRFLRDYLYFPLGGNRKGTTRRYANVMATMLLGGLWHGASWNFVLWGGLHGLYLVINQAWRRLSDRRFARPLPPWAGQALTFAAVAVAWVLFRAPSLAGAGRVLRGLAGAHGLGAPPPPAQALLLAALLAVAWWAPNSLEILTARGHVAHPDPALQAPRPAARLGWEPTRAWALGAALLGALGLLFLVRDVARESPFLYFQF